MGLFSWQIIEKYGDILTVAQIFTHYSRGDKVGNKVLDIARSFYLVFVPL